MNKCNRKFVNQKLRCEKQAIKKMLIQHLQQKAKIQLKKQAKASTTDKMIDSMNALEEKNIHAAIEESTKEVKSEEDGEWRMERKWRGINLRY